MSKISICKEIWFSYLRNLHQEWHLQFLITKRVTYGMWWTLDNVKDNFILLFTFKPLFLHFTSYLFYCLLCLHNLLFFEKKPFFYHRDFFIQICSPLLFFKEREEILPNFKYGRLEAFYIWIKSRVLRWIWLISTSEEIGVHIFPHYHIANLILEKKTDNSFVSLLYCH